MAELGKKLFFDPRLSANNKMSCATCHQPAKAFTNGEKTAIGVHGDLGDRNVPTLINRAGSAAQFWDARTPSLEEQVLVVITASHEMGAKMDDILAKLKADKHYPAQFQHVFGEEINSVNLAKALAAFERTIISGTAPYDLYLAGDKQALTEAQIRGMDLFFNEFRCVSCHSGSNFSDEKLRPRCYPATNNLSEFSPIVVAKEKWIKTPTLRNLIYTGPYMHNGQLSTLDEVVEFYTPSFQVDAKGNPDVKLPVVEITADQRRDLVEFLKALSAPQPYREDSKTF